jgi:hypothetical protein
VLDDDQRLVQTLQAEVTAPNARRVVRGKAGAADFGLEFSQLVVQRAESTLVEVFEEERRQRQEAVGDVSGHRGETLALELDFGHGSMFPVMDLTIPRGGALSIDGGR